MTSKPTVYCASCGAENPSPRGACLLCYAVLNAPGGGLPCPACGHDNVKEGRFCVSCGAPFAPGASRVPGLVESALAVLHGGIANLGPDHDLHAEEDFLGGLAAEPADEAPPALAAPAVAAPAAPVELDDDMLHMPPSALDLQEAAAAPLPAAPALASQPLSEDDFAPPPPPAAPQPVAAPQPLAPAAPISLDDDDMMPPPPPPGAEDLAPAPAAKAAAAPAPVPAAPAAPAAHAATGATTSGTLDGAGLVDPLAQAAAEAGSDEDFGDWSLEFPEDKKAE